MSENVTTLLILDESSLTPVQECSSSTSLCQTSLYGVTEPQWQTFLRSQLQQVTYQQLTSVSALMLSLK